MRRGWSLVLLALLLAGLCLPGVALAAPNPQVGCAFRFGFKTLHDLIPRLVGDCLEDEHAEPASGNALQRTTTGLLVWRKADNWTAFTDGSTTWINGPLGLRSRPNDERFCWEPGAVSSCADTIRAIPPQLESAWEALYGTRVEGQGFETLGELAGGWLRSSRASIALGAMDNAWGSYIPATNTVTITPQTAGVAPEAAAAVLVHELRHADQEARGVGGCVSREVDAMIQESLAWRYLSRGKTIAASPLSQQEDYQLHVLTTRGRQGITALVLAEPGYRDECGLGP